MLRTEDHTRPEIERRSVEILTQDRELKVKESTFAIEIIDLILECTELSEYLKDSWEKVKAETSTIARFRLEVKLESVNTEDLIMTGHEVEKF